MKTPEVVFLEHMLGAARILRGSKVPEVVRLAAVEQQSLLLRLKEAMRKGAGDPAQGPTAVREGYS